MGVGARESLFSAMVIVIHGAIPADSSRMNERTDIILPLESRIQGSREPPTAAAAAAVFSRRLRRFLISSSRSTSRRREVPFVEPRKRSVGALGN